MRTIEIVLTQPIFRALGVALLYSLWQGAVIAALLAVTMAVSRRRTANTRYVIACVALLLMLALPFGTFLKFESAYSTLAASWQRPEGISEAATTKTNVYIPVSDVTNLSRASTSSLAWRHQLFDGYQSAFPLVGLAWLLGILTMSVRWAGGLVQTRWLTKRKTRLVLAEWQETVNRLARRLKVARPVYLLESSLVRVPTVIGWLKPVVLLPASVLTGLTTSQLELIVAHELAHIRRHDYLVNLFQTIVETLLFYHPAVWWVSQQIRNEREHCCDDLAVALGGDALAYAAALAQLENLRISATQLSVAANGGALSKRIHRLVGLKAKRQNSPTEPLASVIILGLVGAAVSWAQISAPRIRHQENLDGPASLTQPSDRMGVDLAIRKEARAEPPREIIRRGNGVTALGDLAGTPQEFDDQVESDNGERLAQGPSVEQEKDAAAEREKNANVAIQFKNPGGVPLVITQAKVRVVNLEQRSRAVARPSGAPSVTMKAIIRSDSNGEKRAIEPSVVLLNKSDRRVVGLALSIKHPESGYEYYFEQHRLVIEPKELFSTSLGGMVFLPGDLTQLQISVVGVRFEDGSSWGNLGVPAPKKFSAQSSDPSAKPSRSTRHTEERAVASTSPRVADTERKAVASRLPGSTPSGAWPRTTDPPGPTYYEGPAVALPHQRRPSN